jgi:hypothetical protein
MSRSPLSPGRARRNHSRTWRFTRLRTTAPPTRRLAVIPSRGPPDPASRRGAARKTNARTTVRRPRRETSWNSLDRRSRSSARKGPVGSTTPTSRASSPPAACVPSLDVASATPGPPQSSSATGTRAPACGELGSADRSASSTTPSVGLGPGAGRGAPQGSHGRLGGQRPRPHPTPSRRRDRHLKTSPW